MNMRSGCFDEGVTWWLKTPAQSAGSQVNREEDIQVGILYTRGLREWYNNEQWNIP